VYPQAVAETVSSVSDDPAKIAAAGLHHVVEDSPVTLKQVKAKFRVEFARLVSDVTNASTAADGNRVKRKAIDRQHSKS
jgi:(p)ppGpp synthase/HD superfamily hydrolase